MPAPMPDDAPESRFAPTPGRTATLINSGTWRTVGYVFGCLGVGILVLLIGAAYLGDVDPSPRLAIVRSVGVGLSLAGLVSWGWGRLAEHAEAIVTIRADELVRDVAGIRSDLGALMVTVRRVEERIAHETSDGDDGEEGLDKTHVWWSGYGQCARDLTGTTVDRDADVVPLPLQRERRPAN